jgi:hypothetical protein
MTIPTSITLNGCEIKVNQVQHLYRNYTHYGEYSCCEMCINIDQDMSEQKKELVICHELIEAVKDIYQLNELDHEAIQPLASAIYEIIKKKQLNFE